MNQDHSILTINGISKTINYDPVTNLPLLHTESGLTKLHTLNNLIQDGGPEDNLSFAQRQLLHWHRRLAHMDFEKLKDFARKRFLPKEIANCKTPLCPFCIQANQQRTSASRSATGGSIKEGDLTPGSKVSCDQYQSSENRLLANNNG